MALRSYGRGRDLTDEDAATAYFIDRCKYGACNVLIVKQLEDDGGTVNDLGMSENWTPYREARPA